MRGIAISRDALQAPGTADLLDYNRIRDKDEVLYRNLEFLSDEIATLADSRKETIDAALPKATGVKPRPGGNDFRLADAILVREALQGLLERKYKNPWDAAMGLCERAKGHGRPRSKAQRLVQLIKLALVQPVQP